MSSPVPADQDATSYLMNLPREVRHIIFRHIADTRTVKPRDTLRYWFEKQDIQEQIDQKRNDDPDRDVTYVAGYNDEYDEEDEIEDEEGQAIGLVVGEDDEDDEGEEQDSEDDDVGVDEHDNEDDGEQDDDEVDHDSDDEDMTDYIYTYDAAALYDAADLVDNPYTAAAYNSNVVQGTNTTTQAYTGVEGFQDTSSTNADGTEETEQATPVAEVKPDRKWRHVPKFMRLTQCPPETNLFLISKQLNDEVKSWFYDVAVLKIDATASFLHLSFFELALTKLVEAPNSPMGNIKKAEITFVWDTTWIRSESEFVGAVFPALLKKRVEFIVKILLRAPELEQVLIHWHDSAEDDGAKQSRAKTVEPFIMDLPAQVDTKDHYITPETKPRAKTRAGKQRLEFMAIVENGCETF